MGAAPLTVGSATVLGKHTWKVDKIDGNYVHVSHGGHRKVIPMGAAVAGQVQGKSARPAVRKATGKTRVKPADEVAQALSECTTEQDLIALAKRHYGLEFSPAQCLTISGLPNHGTRRMYVGNSIRRTLKKAQPA